MHLNYNNNKHAFYQKKQEDFTLLPLLHLDATVLASFVFQIHLSKEFQHSDGGTTRVTSAAKE